MPRNLFSDPFGGLQEGYQTAGAITDDIKSRYARNRAAPKIAQGDFQGAAQAYGAMGMADEARQAVGDQQTVDDRATAAKTREREQQRAVAEERLKILTGVGGTLLKTPLGQRKAKLDGALPLFKASGYSDEAIQALSGVTEEQLTDEGITSTTGQAIEQYKQFFQNEHGIYGVTPQGGVKTLQQFPQKPVILGEGQKLIGPAEDSGAPPQQSGFEAAIGPLLKREGGFTAQDGRSGAPANFGINQKYNPDVDVRSLTPDKAKEVYKSRYWDAINGDQLPPQAQAAVFDAAVNQGPERALGWWKQSGGDVAKFNELRLQHYRSRPDYAQNGKSWERRVQETGGAVPSLAGGSGGDRLPGGMRVLAEGNAKPKRTYRDATTAELRQAGYPVGSRAQVDTETGKFENIKQPTDAEGKNATYTFRALSANDRMNSLAERGIFKPSAQLLISEKNGVTRIVASRPQDRQFIQAAKEWLAPVLRKDTGAAVTDSELLYYMDAYIPRPEDDVGTLRQKANARQDLMKGMVGEAGDLYGARFGKRTFRTLMPAERPKAGDAGKTKDSGDGWRIIR
jgi:lysozyme family protein